MSNILAITPHISEKSFALAESKNVYVFNVPTTANKIEIKKAVIAQFKVPVTSVRIVVVKGKTKKSYQKRNRPLDGIRSDSKHAYVRVEKGNVIPFFEAEDKKSAEKKAETKSKEGTKVDAVKSPKTKGLRRVLNTGSRKTQQRGGDK